MGRGLRQAVRHRARRLLDAGTGVEGQRPLVPRRDPAQRAPGRGPDKGVRHIVTRERPTLEAVARRAGVSRSTVSRVVNGSTTVAVEIRDAVKQAVAELGYVTNQAARSLVTQRTESIALILPETANRVFSDDLFFPAIIRGV